MLPCLIRDDHRIMFVSDVDGSKFKPFMSKENHLFRSQKSLKFKYYSSFVLNAVNNFKVEGTGFEIIEFIPEKRGNT